MNGTENAGVAASDTKRRLWQMGILGLVACGACCAAPIAAWLAGGSALAVFGWWSEGIGIAVLLLGATAVGVFWLRRHRRACTVPPSPTR